MAIDINANGITNQTVGENFQRIKTLIQEIDNPIVKNFTFSSNKIDGNFTNIISLLENELGEVAINLQNNLDPTKAIGIWLDKLSVFFPSAGGRKAATYTEYDIVVTTSGAVNLTTDFTISDGINSYVLKEDVSILGAGDTTLRFQASVTGDVVSLVNSITIIQTPILGVTAVNNPTTAIIAGQKEEDDPSFAFRLL